MSEGAGGGQSRPNPSIGAVADLPLIRAEVADDFNRLIYATAANRDGILLTEDEEPAKAAQRGDLLAPPDGMT